jgi:MFS family permease
MRDRRLLYAAAFVRAIATGMVGVLLAIYLAARGFDPAEAGIVIGVGLSGAGVAALVVTLAGSRLGSRHALVGLGVLGAAGGVAVACVSSFTMVVAAAFLGMVNGMGRDRGAALIIDQAILPATASDGERTRAFAWYNVLQDIGHAVGGLAAGLPVLLRDAGGLDTLGSLQIAVVIHAGLLAVTALIYARLSPAAELPVTPLQQSSPDSRRLLWRISALFAVDSLAGGFLNTALLAWFFYQRFGVGEAMIGALFFLARLANAVSHLGAAWLARRIGLVNTMVFTHIPSSLLLVTVVFAPSFPVAALLFLLREGLVEMDVPTRQSYVMAVVRPEHRRLASGVTHLVRLGGWAVGPAVAGLLMRWTSIATPIFIGAAMKMAYDALLYVSFRRHKPPEELAAR